MQAHCMRSKWFSLLSKEVPRPSEELFSVWEKLQLEWFVLKHEHYMCRMVFKSRECIRASACKKLLKLLSASDLLMERSYRHKGDHSQQNLMYKFGMESEDHFRRYRYEDLNDVVIPPFVHCSVLESVKGVLGREDGANYLRQVFEETCPRYARVDKVAFLESFPSLEIHRKILVLEQYNGGVLDIQQKALAMQDNTYWLVDPVTVYVPLLIGIANEMDMEKLIDYRVQAVRSSLGALCRYCLDLMRNVREIGMPMYGVSNLAEENWMRSTEDVKRVVDKRRITEHAESKRAMVKMGVSKLPMWTAFTEMEQLVGHLMNADNLTKNLTRYLPKTSTRTHGDYNLDGFLCMARQHAPKPEASKVGPESAAAVHNVKKHHKRAPEPLPAPVPKKAAHEAKPAPCSTSHRIQPKKRRAVSGLDV